MDKELKQKIKKIKLVILDVDGVLTDGKIIYSGLKNDTKEFDVKDGFGVTLLHRAGIAAVILSARASKSIKRRALDMHLSAVYQNAYEKLKVYNKILKRFKLQNEQVCFMGDDLVDLPVLRRVGLSICTSCSIDEIKKEADYVTKNKGGSGAVREIADLILKTQGKWQKVTERYYR
jgi:3-deoxy-D-manno-octulosonate 8-phosphate phosphatase (KDO 8-P phosphatase)